MPTTIADKNMKGGITEEQSSGVWLPHFDNPLLNDPRIRFAEEMFAAYEREHGEDGKYLQNVTGILHCFELWCKANGMMHTSQILKSAAAEIKRQG